MITDAFYMKEAILLARQAYEECEVPIGAIVADQNGHIIGRGYNQTQRRCWVGAHAELIALESAGQAQQDWRIAQGTLYVTVQPCLMCISAAALARIQRVVYALPSPMFGVHLSNIIELPSTYAHLRYEQVCEGIVEAEQLMQAFFIAKRD